MLLAAMVAPCIHGQADRERWHRLLADIREDFPGVAHMTTAQLAEKIDRGQPVLLLDARSAEEFRVSHLAGATHAPYVHTALKAIRADRGRSTVVVYCSVGYRSSRLVSRLQRQGVENVFNIEGSLFGWANEGRRLTRGSEAAFRVHPYDDDWGQFLDATLRSE